MLHIRHEKIGFFYIGRDFICDVDAAIAFGLSRRKNCPESEIAWHWTGGVSWNWLPPRIYHFIAPPSDVQGSSASWTGRERAFAGFDWRRWRRPRFNFQHIKD